MEVRLRQCDTVINTLNMLYQAQTTLQPLVDQVTDQRRSLEELIAIEKESINKGHEPKQAAIQRIQSYFGRTFPGVLGKRKATR